MQLKFTIITIILLLHGILSIHKSHKLYHAIRNCTLRVLLKNDIRKTKLVLNNIYDKTIAIYFDSIEAYTNLSEDDKYIIESILSLLY